MRFLFFLFIFCRPVEAKKIPEDMSKLITLDYASLITLKKYLKDAHNSTAGLIGFKCIADQKSKAKIKCIAIDIKPLDESKSFTIESKP